jgi:signal peptidase I
VTDGAQRTAGTGKGGPGAGALTKPAWSAELPSVESAVIDGRRRIVYTGPSMNPTLREPDILWVEPYGKRRVRAGDVVCFESPEHDTNIVHRAISVRPSSLVPSPSSLAPRPSSPIAIRTQGDNNLLPDTRVLAPADLLGRVVAAQRGPQLRSIPGSHTGLMIAWGLRLWKSIWKVVAGIVSRVYQGTVRCGPFDFLLPGGLKPRLVCFSGRDATVYKLLIRGRMVGLYDHSIKEWQIRRPLRLFIDTRFLPVPRSKD